MKRTISYSIYCAALLVLTGSLGAAEESNPYGQVVAVDVKSRDMIEHIALKVPEHCGASHTITRKGVLLRNKNAEATILICHGFMTCKEDVQFIRQFFTPGKYNFMTFDFRGHGEQAVGQCCTFGRDEACEVITAVNFLKHHASTKNKPVLLYAFSMGAVASIQAQAKDPSLFKAMILDCPFDSSERVIQRGLENLKFHFFGYQFTIPARSVLQKYAFHPYVQAMLKVFLKAVAYIDTMRIDLRIYPVDTARAIEKVTVPCFFIHCRNDEKVPLDSIKLLYDKANSSYKKLWITQGRRHYDSFFYNPEEYMRKIREFADQAIHNKLDNKMHSQIIEDGPDVLDQGGYVWGVAGM